MTVCRGSVAVRRETRVLRCLSLARCFGAPALIRGALDLMSGRRAVVFGSVTLVHGLLAVCFLSLPRLLYGWAPCRGA